MVPKNVIKPAADKLTTNLVDSNKGEFGGAYLFNHWSGVRIMTVTLGVGSTGACRIPEAGKVYSWNMCPLRAPQMDCCNGIVTSISLMPRFKVNRGVILCNNGTYTCDLPSREFNFQWISTFLLEYHQLISRLLEPRPWNMVPVPDRKMLLFCWTQTIELHFSVFRLVNFRGKKTKLQEDVNLL